MRRICVIAVARMVAAMGHARDHQAGIVLLFHARQLFEEADRRPDLLVAVIAPGRHAGHLDADA